MEEKNIILQDQVILPIAHPDNGGGDGSQVAPQVFHLLCNICYLNAGYADSTIISSELLFRIGCTIPIFSSPCNQH